MGANFSSEPVVEKHTERDQNETFTAAVSSCQGWRMSQEDEHSLMLQLPGEHKASFFAVFDGHGSGRVSKHASEALWHHIAQNENYIKGNFREALEESFLAFDREVNESYNAQLAGTTAICVLIVDNVIYCANIGDSRAVASINCECLPLSQDHKPENPLELKRILAAGGYVLGNRVNGNLALSRAFGDFHYKSNDQLPAEQQIVCPCPDVKRIELNDEVDFLVLACDGIWDVLSSEEVVNFVISRLERNVEPGLICEQLTTRCIATDYELVIGCDNMTVLLVCHTRGRTWEDYCTDIFEKNTKKLGVPRTRTFDDNFDNTFQPDDRFLRSSSSTEYSSRDTSLDRTFAANETSTDSDNSSSENRGDSLESRDPVKELLGLLDVLNGSNIRLGGGAGTSASDETPPITEILVRQSVDQPTLSDKPVTERDGKNADESSEGDSQDEQNETKTQQSNITTTETDKPDMSAEMSLENREESEQKDDEADGMKFTGTTEIHLAAPDEDEETSNELKPNQPDEVNLESKSQPDEEVEDLSQKTIEIQLGLPDDGMATADGQTGEPEGESCDSESPEVVNDLPDESEATNQEQMTEEPSSPAEEENTDSKDDNEGES